MNETKKVVDSKKVMIEMLEAGDKYFTNKETWSLEGVREAGIM